MPVFSTEGLAIGLDHAEGGRETSRDPLPVVVSSRTASKRDVREMEDDLEEVDPCENEPEVDDMVAILSSW